MNDFYKDIYIGVLFVWGMLGYMSGEFIISSLLFAAATIASQVKLKRSNVNARQFLCGWCPHLKRLT